MPSRICSLVNVAAMVIPLSFVLRLTWLFGRFGRGVLSGRLGSVRFGLGRGGLVLDGRFSFGSAAGPRPRRALQPRARPRGPRPRLRLPRRVSRRRRSLAGAASSTPAGVSATSSTCPRPGRLRRPWLDQGRQAVGEVFAGRPSRGRPWCEAARPQARDLGQEHVAARRSASALRSFMESGLPSTTPPFTISSASRARSRAGPWRRRDVAVNEGDRGRADEELGERLDVGTGDRAANQRVLEDLVVGASVRSWRRRVEILGDREAAVLGDDGRARVAMRDLTRRWWRPCR